jgi:hypothetical protein
MTADTQNRDEEHPRFRARGYKSGVRTRRGRSAASWQRPDSGWHAARIGQGAAQQHVNLRIQAAELVVRPPREGVVQGRIESEQQLFALRAHV